MVKLRILVVDDDDATRRVVGRILTRQGHAVESRESGHGALELLRASPYDLLLTDMVMPVMSGLRLIAAARAIHPMLRFLVMSGHARDPECPSDVGWLEKPIDGDNLLVAIG